MPDWPLLERLDFEAEAVGFHLSAHPLDAYAKALRRLGVTPCAQVETARRRRGAGEAGRHGGGAEGAGDPTGNRMAWVALTDASGCCEVTLFAEVLARAARAAGQGIERADHRRAAAGRRDDARSPRRTWCRWIRRRSGVGGGDADLAARPRSVPHIRDLLGREGRARDASCWCRVRSGAEVEIALPGGFNVTPRLAQAMKVMPGVAEVEVV